MAIGDVTPVTLGDASNVYCLDTGMFDLEAFGAVYVVDAERPALVDTGLGTHYDRVLDAMDEVGIAPEDLEVVALTHVHLDHAGGAGFLAEACPNARVYVHPIGAPHVVDPSRLVEGTKRAVGEKWQYYVEPASVPEERIVEIEDGDAIDLGDRTLDVHHAPGHAPHQVVFDDRADDLCFVADAAGIRLPSLDRVSPTSPPPNFDLERCLDDVAMLKGLAPGALCYPHFGPVETDDVLSEYERVLSEWVEAIEAAREELGDDEAVVERFVERESFSPALDEQASREEVTMNVRGALVYLDRREA